MDSATYGVPSTSAQGYKLTVQNAVRIDNSGNFVHSAPWSVGDQGKRNVSHGCINLAPANAQWFYDNFGSGDPVVVKNSVGTYNAARRRAGLADLALPRRPDPRGPQSSAAVEALYVTRMPDCVDLGGRGKALGYNQSRRLKLTYSTATSSRMIALLVTKPPNVWMPG